MRLQFLPKTRRKRAVEINRRGKTMGATQAPTPAPDITAEGEGGGGEVAVHKNASHHGAADFAKNAIKFVKEGAVATVEGVTSVVKSVSGGGGGVKGNYAVVYVFVAIAGIGLLFGLIFGILWLKRQWRLFRKSDEGKAKLQKLYEHPQLGPHFEKLFPPITAANDSLQLTKLEELPGMDEEEGGGEGAEPPPPLEPMGRLHYKIEYDFEENNFIVHVLECKELKARESTGASDPYVKVFFMGDKKSFRETKVHRNTLNPNFNETIVYKKITYDELMGKLLNFEVYDYVRFKTDEQIGEYRVRLCMIDLMTPYEEWVDWEAPEDDEEPPPGKICLSLRYTPKQDRLTLAVVECKALKEMDFGGGADPFVKITFFKNGQKMEKKKTEIKKCTLNPYFNVQFTYKVMETELNKIHFMVSVYDYNLIGPSEAIGKILLGPNEAGDAKEHFEEMLANPRRPIMKWYDLKEPEEFKEKKEKEVKEDK